MVCFTLECESRQEAEEAADTIWNELDITGELSIKPGGEDLWQVEVVSEKNLRRQAIEDLPGRVTEMVRC